MKRSVLSENAQEMKYSQLKTAKMEGKTGSNSRQKAEVSIEEEVLVAENLSMQAPPKKGRKFKEEWLIELRWLRYDPSTGTAQCTLCNKFPAISRCTSKVVKGFTGPFKLETFKKHEKSHQHQKCVSRDGVEMEKFDDLKIVFNVAYYIAKNNKPFSDIDGLFTLVEKLGVYLGDEDHYNEGCQEFIRNISNILRQELIIEINSQPFVSLFIDGSAEKIGDEEINVYVRYVQNKEVKDVFLATISIGNHTSEGYFQTIRNEMEKLNLSHCLNSNVLIGIGTDGTPNLIRAQNEFVQNIREHLPHLIATHSIAYRLNYSLLSAIRDDAAIESIDSILKMLFNFYRSSHKRLKQLQQLQAEDFHQRIVKFENVNSVRWIVCKVGALTSLMKDWKCVVTHLESVVAEAGNSSTVASELLKKLKDFKFLHMLQFLIDYLDNFKRLSQVFEKPNTFFNAVVLHVENAVIKLTSLNETPGYHEMSFLTNISIEGIYQTVQLHGFENWSIQKIKENMVVNGIKYLKERFLSNNDHLESCTSIFDTFTWPTGKDLATFGKEEIRSLARMFHKQLCIQNMSKEDLINQLLREWFAFKDFGKGLQFNELLKKVLSNFENFPIISKLIRIVAVLPFSTVTCQRGFKLMNDIKNKFISSMEIESLNDLMFINMNGPPINEFDPSKAVEHWLFTVKAIESI